jgi:peptidoglycan/LPS O-acetylase OafA/YrhL
MAGALLAVIVRSERFAPLKHVKLAWISFVLTASLAILAANHGAKWIAFSMTSWASASLIYLSLFSQWKWVQSIFLNRFLSYTGTISYGLYLLHKIPLDVIKTTHVEWHPFFSMCMAIAFSYLLAAVSWTILEKPFLKLKRFFDFKPVAKPWSDSASMQALT